MIQKTTLYTFLLIFSLFYTPKKAQAQNHIGNITFYNTPAVENLIQRHIAYNQTQITREGYRIHVLQDNNRDKLRAEKTRFTNLFSYKAYENYNPPYFKLRAGDFKDRFAAQKALTEIKRQFKMAFIMKEKINIADW